ncbi:MAG: GNAT family N-acetyltransferase [Rhizobiaceae bacterium]
MNRELDTCQKDDDIHLGSYEKFDFFQYRNFDEVARYWKMLRTDETCSPFQQFSWINATVSGERQYAKYNEQKQSPYLFVVGFVDQKPVVILPFAVSNGLLGDRLTWIGGNKSDYNGIQVDQDNCAGVSGAAFNKILGMIYKSNTNIHAAILTRNLSEAQYILLPEEPHSRKLAAEYGAYALTLHKDWGELFSSIRSSKSRQRLRSKSRKLKNEGRVVFGRVRDAVKRHTVATQILDWKNEQLENSGRPSPFGTSADPSQLRLTIENAISKNDSSLQVIGLFLDGKLIAGMLAFVTNDTFYYYVSSYSTSVARNLSVGTILIIKTLEFASRCGLKRYDFLIGDEPYKFDWCDTEIPLVHYTRAFDRQGWVICSLFQLSLAVKKFLLRYPNLVASVRNFLKRIPSFNVKSTDVQGGYPEIPKHVGYWNKTKKRA